MPVIKSNDISKLIDDWDPKLRRAFLDSVREMRDGADFNTLVEMIKSGDIDGAIRAVGIDPTDFRPLDAATSQAYESSAVHTLKDIRNADRAGRIVTRVKVRFDMRNPSAEQWLRDHSATRVTEITADQRVLIREYLTDAMARGENPRAAALGLVGRVNPVTGVREGGVVGLTSSQAEWVRSYEADLMSENPRAALSRTLRDRRFDSTVARFAETAEAIPAALIEKMVISYANRALMYRAESIGRTEAMASLHEGQQQAMEQLQTDNGISDENIDQTWHTAHDKRVRDSHVDMDGQTVKIGEMFVTGAGNELEYPGDPNGPIEEIIQCRCWREFRVDFLAGIQ